MFTYFIQGHPLTPVKIGRARNVASRLASLQTGTPNELRVLLTLEGDREAELHAMFSAWRTRGEWFLWCDAISDFIKKHGDRRCSVWSSVNAYCTDRERDEFNEWHTRVLAAADAARDWIRAAAVVADVEIPPQINELMDAIGEVPWLSRA